MEPTSYHRYSRWLHWIMAFLLLSMVFLGWSFDIRDEARFARIQLHKSIGITILVLTALRIWLRLKYKAPPEAPMPKWQELAAKSVHVGFYVLMIALPLTGWALVSTSKTGIPTVLYGVLPLPHLPLPLGVHETAEGAHNFLAKLLIYVLIPLHLIGALKHHFFDRDDTLNHMLPGVAANRKWSWLYLVPVGVIAGALILGYGIRGKPLPEREATPPPEDEATQVVVTDEAASAVVSETASASVSASASASVEKAGVRDWTVTKSASKIAFETSYSGDAVSGSFGGYRADIRFDPEALDKSRVRVRIDLASVNSGDSERDQTLESSDFFNVSSTPTAIFEADRFEKTGANAYVARGKLTLRGVTKPHNLPFSLTIKGDTADMRATTEIDRIAYGVGGGMWADTAQIPQKVKVAITLRATAQ